MKHHLSSADVTIFYRKSTIFVISRNADLDCILIYDFYLFKTFFESGEVVLINTVASFMISTTLATLGLLKRKMY